MKFYTFIPAKLKLHFYQEIEEARIAFEGGDLQKSWNHLERAHILGQAYPFEHSLAHGEMLKFGFKIKSMKEVRGQILRLVFGGVKSFVGKIPEGNTGGANVHPLQPMQIPLEMEEILKAYKK